MQENNVKIKPNNNLVLSFNAFIILVLSTCPDTLLTKLQLENLFGKNLEILD